MPPRACPRRQEELWNHLNAHDEQTGGSKSSADYCARTRLTLLAPHLSRTFVDFLEFEQRVFGDPPPIAYYDPYLIRYGEYRFVLDTITFTPEQKVLDLGCETNIFMFYLASKGVSVLAVDIDPSLESLIEERKDLIRARTGLDLDLSFFAGDATDLDLRAESVDAVVATSSIEHMFSSKGDGDTLAVSAIARVLKRGCPATVTVPMSNGGPFHEAPAGDERFDGPYRLYTPQALREKILGNSSLRLEILNYLMQTTPDPRYAQTYFAQFWTTSLSPEERLKWAWANPLLAAIFNPRVSAESGERAQHALNTALICLRKQ
jgi:ubiquinone/menaquinone biosynthesis C-methylase UbiE